MMKKMPPKFGDPDAEMEGMEKKAAGKKAAPSKGKDKKSNPFLRALKK